MRNTPGIHWNILSILLIGVGATGDVIGGLTLLQHHTLQGLILHLGSVLVWSAGCFMPHIWRPSKAEDGQARTSLCISILDGQNTIVILLGLCLFPGLAALGFILAWAVARLTNRPRRHKLAEDEEAEFADPLAEIVAAASAPAPSLANLEIRPLVETLSAADFETKQAALDLICREPGPLALALARRLLPDPDPDVRTLAAVAVARLETHFSASLKSATARLESEPGIAEHYASLGQLYARYAQADTGNPANRQFFLVQARQAFERAIALEPVQDDIRASLVEVLMALGEEQQAWDEVMALLARCPNKSQGYLLGMEIALRRRKFWLVTGLAWQARAALPDSNEVMPLINWWYEVNVQSEGDAS